MQLDDACFPRDTDALTKDEKAHYEQWKYLFSPPDFLNKENETETLIETRGCETLICWARNPMGRNLSSYEVFTFKVHLYSVHSGYIILKCILAKKWQKYNFWIK